MVVNVRILFVCNDRQQLLEPLASLRWHNPHSAKCARNHTNALSAPRSLKLVGRVTSVKLFLCGINVTSSWN